MTRTLLLLLTGLSAFAHPDPSKKALIIAIGNYHPATGWPALSSLNDLKILTHTLRAQEFATLSTLTDEQATAAGIRKAFAALIAGARPGDKIVIHFSGHGQQIYDVSGDEADDGLDETLVPYDAPMIATYPAYKGEKHILDDEIGRWLSQLQKKVGTGGQVLLLLDSCHSGTATRTAAPPPDVRGGAPPIVPDGFLFKTGDTAEDTSVEMTRGAAESGTVVAISAARANQLNYQIKTGNNDAYGSLTYAVCESFKTLQPGDDYAKLFSKIVGFMDKKLLPQTPVFEGAKNLKVLNGAVIATPAVLTVLKDSYRKLNKTITISAGYVAGIYENAVISLSTSRGQPVARGRVIRAGSFDATLELDTELPPEHLDHLEASVLEKAMGNEVLKISLDPSVEEPLRSAMTTRFLQHSLVPEKTGGDLVIRREKGYIQLVNKTVIFDSIALADPDLIPFIEERISDFNLSRIFKNLELNEDKNNIRLSLLTVNQKNGTPAERFEDNIPVVRTGEPALLKIKNNTSRELYCAIVDIQPDARLGVVFNEKLAPEEEKTLSLEVSPPYGLEVYKAILTPQLIDIESAIRARGASVRSGDDPVSRLFLQNFRGEPVQTGQISTQSYLFRIIPPG